LETKANLKTETISDAIKVLRKIPGFSEDTFLEIFVRMKLHSKKVGEEASANEVNQVIANLQNLAKYGLVSPKDGFNSFLQDISQEIQNRQAPRNEHLRELERLKHAIAELDDGQKFMEAKRQEFERMLDSLRKTTHDTRTKKFKYKDLEKAKVIYDSQIPPAQQPKVVFEITHSAPETFQIKGKIKGILNLLEISI
jgi:chromosome segregation ATPase